MTAVEWIEGYLKKFNHIEESLSLKKAFEQAKAMEKEIIRRAYLDGIDNEYTTSKEYYNENFKSE